MTEDNVASLPPKDPFDYGSLMPAALVLFGFLLGAINTIIGGIR